MVDFLLVLIELFRQLSRLRRYELCVRKGGGHFERTFQGEWGSPPTTVGVRKLHRLSRGVICVILRLT